MVLCISWTEVEEILCDGPRFRLGSQQIPHQPILQKVPPNAARKLCETEAEGEKEGKPEIVGSHWSILLLLNPRLVYEAARGLALEMFPDVGGSMDPAVRPCILVPSLTHDCSPIQMILQKDEEQTEHYYKGGSLVMKFEQRIVYDEIVSFEPLE